MSDQLTPVEPANLEAVTAGAALVCSTGGTGKNKSLVNQLTTLATTLRDVNAASNTSGLSTTTILMLGLMMQQRTSPVVFVRR